MAYVIDINPDDPKSIDAALRTEWLLTNGLGGYAMGTALGVNTRRYHGLLVAATTPPVGRIVALHLVIEQLIVPREDGTEEVIDLSAQQFVGGDGQPMLHPSGWRWLRQFECDARQVSWTWRRGDLNIRRTVQAAQASQGTRILYEVRGDQSSWRLRVRPFFSFRDYHALTHASAGGGQPDFSAFLNVAHTADRWIDDSQTWDRFAYVADRDRGQDWVEDNLWSPCFWEFDRGNPESLTVSFSYRALDREVPKQRPVIGPWAHLHQHGANGLSDAAGQFVVKRWLAEGTTASVIAGYPWFGDWGRDTMIALPGLMLCTGRLDEARSTLECFAKHLRNGLIPNLFDDYGGAAHYNTVDASLWFVHAVHALWNQSSSPQGRGETSLLAPCREIIAAYRRGTDFNIRIDSDGLIIAGDESTQLTWMDAKRDGVVFTPRHGKAVEINALWHNALVCFSDMTDDANERNEVLMLARQVAASFRSAFWWDHRQCLHDCLAPAPPRSVATSRNGRFAADGRLRPNQILAVSLPFSPLNEMQQRAVVKVVGERLLTPFGLRTLERDDPNYKPRYEGDLFQRDAAYHNGTVWPWLIGPYCEALLRIEKFSDPAKQRVRTLLQPLIDEMSNASGGRCLGQIAEVYDGDPPHRPSGCPAQAWSVAEVLRVLILAE